MTAVSPHKNDDSLPRTRAPIQTVAVRPEGVAGDKVRVTVDDARQSRQNSLPSGSASTIHPAPSGGAGS
ncbi:hypothetical protein CLV30_13110 [Haloactinopolyspora alba]|uniref:Uncharacterized protein n=1 Tax=Haloactinopolyspora alba TaxID=648780 RepID=A0A2P8D6X8_9ACTN|nr:hypothetical protein CLV30_13110 [Haloactinopolyspora alba]